MATSKKNSDLGSIDKLQKLQSELSALRQKSILALEESLQVIEKSIQSKTAATQKQRAVVAEAQKRLSASSAGSRQYKVAAEKLAKASSVLEVMQSELASLRGEAIEQKLRIRREKAVLKAVIDTEKSLKSAKVAKKSPPRAKQPPLEAASIDQPPAAGKPASPVKKKASQRKTSKVAAINETAANSPSPPPKTAPPGPRPVRRRSNVPKHMSDIPSHPKNKADRLASLFDDY